MIIEEKQTAEDSGDWATRAKQCIEDMEARRSKKLPQRELNRQLKEGNYAALAECVPLSALAALADSPDRPEDPADPLRAAVEALLREAQQLRQKIEAEAGAELSEARARELLVETIKARVGRTDPGDLPGSKPPDQARRLRAAGPSGRAGRPRARGR